MRLQLTLIGADELAKRLIVSGLGPGRHVRGHPADSSRLFLRFRTGLIGTDPARRQNWARTDTRGVSGDIIGPAVNAVLVPPQVERFASLVGADTSLLVPNVSGGNKLVLLDSDRVFLFPRSAIGVEWFERELAAYRALADPPG